MKVIANFGKPGFDGTRLEMKYLISGIAHNNCTKLNVYLVSKTCLLLSLKFLPNSYLLLFGLKS
jgi:hypothetical protein